MYALLRPTRYCSQESVPAKGGKAPEELVIQHHLGWISSCHSSGVSLLPEHHDYHTQGPEGGVSGDSTDAGRRKHDVQDVHSVTAHQH